jgi:signal transduction histidine kinase
MQRDAGVGVVRLELSDRLKALCGTFCERHGVDCRLDVRDEHTRLKPADADAVYQSIRELLTLYKRRVQTTEIEVSSELRHDGSIAFHVGDAAAARAVGTIDSLMARDEVALSNIDQRLQECGAYLERPLKTGSWASVVLPGRNPLAT